MSDTVQKEGVLLGSIVGLLLLAEIFDYLLVKDAIGIHFGSWLISYALIPEIFASVILGLMARIYSSRLRSAMITLGCLSIMAFEFTPLGNSLALALVKRTFGV